MIDQLFFYVLLPFVGTTAYVALFHVPKQYYVSCGCTGVVSWTVSQLAAEHVSTGLAAFLAALAAVFLSRMLTVRKKCPLTIFLAAGIIPLVPGTSVYYTIYYLVTNQLALAAQRGLGAVKVAFGIVLGIVFVVAIPREVFQTHYWKLRREQKGLKKD